MPIFGFLLFYFAHTTSQVAKQQSHAVAKFKSVTVNRPYNFGHELHMAAIWDSIRGLLGPPTFALAWTMVLRDYGTGMWVNDQHHPSGFEIVPPIEHPRGICYFN